MRPERMGLGVYDQNHFVVVVDPDWKEKGLLVVKLNRGRGDETDCMMVPADWVESVVNCLRDGLKTFDEYKQRWLHLQPPPSPPPPTNGISPQWW